LWEVQLIAVVYWYLLLFAAICWC